MQSEIEVNDSNNKSFREWLREKELFEAKQVGTIYHFTKPENIIYLIDKNRQAEYGLEIFEFFSMSGNFSTTRNASLTSDFTHPILSAKKGYSVRISLDGDKISNKYKIKPIRGLNDNDFDVFGKNKERVPLKWGEDEEVIIGNNKKKDESTFKLKDYILQIDIIYLPNTNKEDTHNYRDYIEQIVKQNGLSIPVNIVKKFVNIKNTNSVKLIENAKDDELSIKNCRYLEISHK